MGSREEPSRYASALPFESARIGAAAIYCSDGRLGDHFDDFLHTALRLPRYDRLALPGGAACLAGHFDTWLEEHAAVEQLRFLIEAHGLRRVVLIAHQDCAYYTRWLAASPQGLTERQHADLRKAAVRIRLLGPGLAVDAWFARPAAGTVSFDRID
jgi:hypothetical protein